VEPSSTCFVVVAPGLEGVVAEECRALRFAGVRLVPGGVEIEGGLEAGMRACLWLRAATTVRLRLGTLPVRSVADLERGLARLPLRPVLPHEGPVEVHATARRSRLKHTGRIAAAVARAFPRVDWKRGTGGLHLRIEGDRALVSMDLAGERLHVRGWRLEGGPAPLRETLAAGMLGLCGWAGETPLLDPMCGSGTIAIEGALLATRRAPGLHRRFAFERFAAFDVARHRALLGEAEVLALPAPVPLVASDRHPGAVGSATRNAERAGVAGDLEVLRRDLAEAEPPATAGPGLLLTNPPYGGRLDARGYDLVELYRVLGRVVRERFAGWQVALLCPDERLAQATGLDLDKGLALTTGGIRVRLYRAGG